MRTNIVINDELISEAMKYSSSRTKKGLIEEALRTFVAVKDREVRRATYARRVQELDRKLAELKLRESPGSVLRADRLRR
ncbi:MAG: type II toxin-antitoxin system VapB family antitoxin [Candidatus Hydrogenedentota bacterium]|nr:MAG: type II toxin-antitoxin system VapB family antitoxin [Candidatus Hydrogenedentota bacterium]